MRQAAGAKARDERVDKRAATEGQAVAEATEAAASGRQCTKKPYRKPELKVFGNMKR
jgi:hypothetical protein